MENNLAILYYDNLEIEKRHCSPGEARQMAQEALGRGIYNCKVDYIMGDYGLPTYSFVVDRGKVKKVRNE